jgi:saccharopine dehydrogenase-like NADP-dependent oxidoreductase
MTTSHVPFRVALFGAGAIGEAIAVLLARSGRYSVIVADGELTRAQRVASFSPLLTAQELALDNASATKALLREVHAVICALPFFCNTQVAAYAHECGTHYLDLTEDVEVTEYVTSLSTTSESCFIPQCGLAPGYVSIVAHALACEFSSVESIKLRVGALPRYPSNKMKYNRTWSTDGLVNEYLRPCTVIKGGKKQQVVALEGYETLNIDGTTYEAFHTSGGIGSLCESLSGRVTSIDYKSLRYVGHRDLILFLLDDLNLRVDPRALVRLFDQGIRRVEQDVCIVLVEVIGETEKGPLQRTHVSKVTNQRVGSLPLSAIQITTAAGICAPLDLLLKGELPRKKGLVRIEEIALTTFLSNEFGSMYLSSQ